MAMKFTEEQLNSFDKSMLIQLFLNQQEQLEKVSADLHSLDTKMQASIRRSGITSVQPKLSVIWRHRNQRLWSRHRNAEKKQLVRKHRICPGFLQIGSTTT